MRKEERKPNQFVVATLKFLMYSIFALGLIGAYLLIAWIRGVVNQ